MALFGYAGKILRVDLSSRRIENLDTADYVGRFLGGRGIGAKIYWDETGPQTRALEPANCLVIMTGPLAGFTRLSGSRWQICGKSAEMEPEAFSYAGLGGSWGAWLKYAGFDGLAVLGKADSPVYILVEPGRTEIRGAADLWGKTTVEASQILQTRYGTDARILDIGPAAENQVTFSTVLASENSSGSSGFGAVMGSKNLKAIVVRAGSKIRPQAAHPSVLQSLVGQIVDLHKKNYENYGHETPISGRPAACYGCIRGCTRAYYAAPNNLQYKSFCQSSAVYMGPAIKYYGAGEKAVEVNKLANRLCDEYGLDTAILEPMLDWLFQCYQKGILSESETGLPLSSFGSQEFIEAVVHQISYRQGFGNILAAGTLRAAANIGRGSGDLVHKIIITRAGETRDYDPRLILANAMIYATEPRRAIHLLHASGLPLKRWLNWLEGWQDAFLNTEVIRDIAMNYWGSEKALDFSSYEGKAGAACKIQDYGYVKESLILCDLAWPIYAVNPPDRTIGPGTLESRLVSAVTGQDMDERELLRTGERIFNLQRAILLRQGWGGRQGDTLMGYLFREPIEWTFFDPQLIAPDKNGQPLSRKNAILDVAAFEKIKDEYYQIRGWEVSSGLPVASGMNSLNLDDVSAGLRECGLLR
ncbi:MAG TPA: aldehyde ferredoxin oxidoreductase N-terminal domain-containing protein [Dehalococcoidales bacterium]|nr:aldehyde ferredoxin oxidoreductase N-terminal domain-containing protein [Dehalococcoidales bacterium]